MDSNFWDNVYKSKNENEVSWFQATPMTSIRLIDNLNVERSSPVIDIGGGESRLIDNLLDKDFSNLSLLDISAVSLSKVKDRIGDKFKNVQFINSNIIDFSPSTTYNLWHDRAAFHFLTDKKDISKYVEIASNSIKTDGHLILSTFSKTGPDKCSGLPISKYDHLELDQIFNSKFKLIQYFYEQHETPWHSNQDFVFCVFKKI